MYEKKPLQSGTMNCNNEKLIAEAGLFICTAYTELGKSQNDIEQRIKDITSEIYRTDTYRHTLEELQFGAKLAWRNSSRCIGRLFWESLEVFDERDADSEEAIAEALYRHIAYATNKGNIRSAITVFAPASGNRKLRIWNHQLIRYAGYETKKGILGDPASVLFTNHCLKLGWRGKGTRFDVLPLVIQMEGCSPKWFDLPPDLVLEVPLEHPELERFSELGLKWYAVPIISDMMLELGGLHYTAAPFNGWYMETEIGARNLADTDRYDQLSYVADLMELDCSSNVTLWKDRALVELNRSVLFSFKKRGVSIIDHHTAAEQFTRFETREKNCGREITGRWSWLIPPLSPAASPLWHKSYADHEFKPNFFYQNPPYKV